MCIAPNIVHDGIQVACHKCWQCREQAINDWVGRNIAESKTVKACHAVTLTYGRNSANDADHERSTVLTYSDLQKYLKLLRRHGYSVRYFVTGEFGSLKGRAHWHVMLYWQDQVPEHVLDKNFMEDHWPHGLSYWTKPTAAAIRYNCKYIQKDMGDDARQGHLAMSKKPPIGAKYFAAVAEQYVRAGLAPQTLGYRFPEVRRKSDNKPLEFMLKERSAELFLEHYIKTWGEVHPDRDWPKSELVDLFFEYGRVVTDENRLDKPEGGFKAWAAQARARLRAQQPGYVNEAKIRRGPSNHADWEKEWRKNDGKASASQLDADAIYRANRSR